MKPLVIGDLVAKIPIIQGGMGVGVSACNLAGAVALEGGIGVISAAQLGYLEDDYDENAERANLRAIGKHIKKAKEISKGGIIGINIMVATRNYAEYVKAAVEAKVDLIISGAGLPMDLPSLVKGSTTKIAPIVSSIKAANVILKMWDKKEQRVPDAVVIEGPLAGGHLGFKYDELEHIDELNYDNEVIGIMDAVKQYEEKYQKHIPVILAGGVATKEDVKHCFDLGADGVQVASRFVATKECDADIRFKEAYVNAKKEDIVIVKSPVGMPGRAVKNSFMERVMSGERVPTKHCRACVTPCKPATTPYCISDALINAVKGNLEEALIFCGGKIDQIKEITTVKQVIEELMCE